MNEQNFGGARASVATRGERNSRAGWKRRSVIVAAAVLAGCATTGPTLGPDSPVAEKERVVGERASARWQAIIRKDFAAAYEYFSPASREVISAGGFTARMSVFPYRAIKVDKVECEREVCTVNLTLTYDNPQMKMTNVPTPLQESWVIDREQAWFVFRD